MSRLSFKHVMVITGTKILVPVMTITICDNNNEFRQLLPRNFQQHKSVKTIKVSMYKGRVIQQGELIWRNTITLKHLKKWRPTVSQYLLYLVVPPFSLWLGPPGHLVVPRTRTSFAQSTCIVTVDLSNWNKLPQCQTTSVSKILDINPWRKLPIADPTYNNGFHPLPLSLVKGCDWSMELEENRGISSSIWMRREINVFQSDAFFLSRLHDVGGHL